jgi:hypothetical protein
MCGKISFTPQLLDLTQKGAQPEQIVDPEESPPVGHDGEGVGAVNIGPPRRHRADASSARLPKEHAVLPPRVPVANELELLSPHRVEGMDDSEASSIVDITCS